MAPKTTKIDDVKDPGKVMPAASGRPIVVTNRPMLSRDPMMVNKDSSDEGDGRVESQVAKTITPTDENLRPSTEPEPEKKTEGLAEEAGASSELASDPTEATPEEADDKPDPGDKPSEDV